MRQSLPWREADEIKTVELGDSVGLEHLVAVARYGARVSFQPHYVERVERCRRHVDRISKGSTPVYGINTGLGENWKRTISIEELQLVQKHHVLSHACSVGEPLADECVRAMMFVMLVHMGTGHTGIGLGVLRQIESFLNEGLTPVVPSHGSVGYLCHEGHIASSLIGVGRCRWRGENLPALEALSRAGLTPITLQSKEGLTLLSGTTSVTALAALGFYDALIIAQTADICGAMSLEALRGTLRAMDPRVHQARPHAHQINTASNVRELLKGSAIAEAFLNHRVQDALSLRCIPQLHGAAKKVLADGLSTLTIELNSSVDNPLIFETDSSHAEAVMACNADGSYVGMAADCAAVALTGLMKMAERRIDRLINLHVSELPPFLNKSPGLNNGLMIPQYAAAGLLGELRLLSQPSTTDNAVTCALQEDYTSMGGNAALKLYKAAQLANYILGIELLNVCQAQDFHDLSPSPATKAVHDAVRKKVPFIDEDRCMQPFIESLAMMVQRGEILGAAESVVGPLAF